MRLRIWALQAALLAVTTAMSQTITVHPLNPVNIPDDQALAITNRVQQVTAQYKVTVDRSQGYQALLDEHVRRQAGATQAGEDDSLGLTSADLVISGSTGATGSGRWFINLIMTEVNTSKELCSKYATVGSYQDLMTMTRTVTKALLECTNIEDDEHVTSIKDTQPIIIGTGKIIVETHVYQHAPGTYSKPRFIPCPMCGGTGKMRCSGSELCPSGYKDCPYCSVTSNYNGVTGHWEQ